MIPMRQHSTRDQITQTLTITYALLSSLYSMALDKFSIADTSAIGFQMSSHVNI